MLEEEGSLVAALAVVLEAAWVSVDAESAVSGVTWVVEVVSGAGAGAVSSVLDGEEVAVEEDVVVEVVVEVEVVAVVVGEGGTTGPLGVSEVAAAVNNLGAS